MATTVSCTHVTVRGPHPLVLLVLQYMGQMWVEDPARAGPELNQGCGPQVGQINFANWVTNYFEHLKGITCAF